MSVRPAVDVFLRSTPVPRAQTTDVGTSFVTGLTDTGPANTPVLVTNMADFERIFGLRQAYSILYDALDVYFREGGSLAWVSRIVGPAATTGTKNLLDAGAGTALVVSALGPGSGSSSISVGVRAGIAAGSYVIFVVVGGVEVETSPDLADQNAAVIWSKNSSYIRVALGATALNPAVVAAGALSAGGDDRNNIVDAQRQTALDAFPKELGPGAVWEPGVATTAAYTRLLTHAKNNWRWALLDAPNTRTVATIQASANAARSGNQRFGAMFAPWYISPGIIAGTYRSIPPSAVVAGILARNDGSGLGPSDPAAGDLGVSNTATDLTQTAFTDAERGTLTNSGINTIRLMFGTARVFGWRSLVDAVADSDWVDFGHARLYGAIASRAWIIGQAYAFDKIDGQGLKLAEFGKDLKGLLMEYYRDGDLYGATADEAFRVDVTTVNTPQTLQLNELHAALIVKMSPFAEYIRIDIVKRPITEGVL